jgi:hypothetical protein
MSELIRTYEDGARRIKELFERIPEAALDYRPRGDDRWTIRQHLIHLVDSDFNHFIRMKSCVAQPRSNIYVIDELEWVRNLGDRKEDAASYIELFCLLRKVMSRFLSSVPEEEFASRYFLREYQGEKRQITLAEAVKMYCGHVDFHVEYIAKIIDEYGAETAPRR